MEKTRVRLNICGVEIIVSGNVEETATQQIADAVRSRMQNILNTAYAANVEKAAVITAMNLCEELEDANRRLAALEEELTHGGSGGRQRVRPAPSGRRCSRPPACRDR